ncbi:MAG: MFS transporter [Actinobacteria bacterium]|nr:MFS transporter [Actinomycetota bacterium]
MHTRRPLFTLLGANAISMTGNVMALVAIPWFVLATTGSPAKTGLALAANVAPFVIASFFGGPLVDQLGPRRMSIISDLLSSATVAAIPLLHLTVGLRFWQLIALTFLGALFDAPGTIARGTLIPDTSKSAGWSLERASGLYAVIERGARLAGSPIAGVLVALVGPTNVLLLDAVTFLVSAALISSLAKPAVRPPAEKGTYLSDIAEAVRFIRRDPFLTAMVLSLMITNFLDMAGTVALPVVARRVYHDPIALGLLMGAMGGGSVLGALVFASRGDRHRRSAVYIWSFMLISIWYPVVATFPPLAIAIAAMFVAGLAAGPINPVIDTVMFERVPKRLRGRVLGAIGAFAWLAMPLGAVAGGWTISWVGLRLMLFGTGAIYLTSAIVLGRSRGIKQMDESVAATPAGASEAQL